jgi:hypothetical protein
LYDDALEIYEHARRDVLIPRSDGTQQKYTATRYKQQIERAYENNELVPAIARIIRSPTTGFGHLENAGPAGSHVGDARARRIEAIPPPLRSEDCGDGTGAYGRLLATPPGGD